MDIVDIIKALAGFAWLALIGLIVLLLVRAGRNQSSKGIGSTTIIVLVAALVLSVLGSGLVFLQADQYAVVRSVFQPNGYRAEPLGPGMHLIIPFVESVPSEYVYSIARQTYTMSVAPAEGQIQGDDSIRARTKDGQEVYIDASIIYSIDPGKVIQLHINWQKRYENDVVRPAARNAIRDAVSQFGVEEIVSTKRAEMEEMITETIRAKMEQNDLHLEDFLLRDIHFSEQYAAAVEQKQIAEQQAQQARLTVEQKKQEAEQARQIAQGRADAAVIEARGEAEARIIQAEAEAKANQLLAQSLTPALVQYQYILKLSPGVQTIFVPSDQQFILPLPGSTQQTTPATVPTTTP
ncbi:MAG TPA: SPFH domain-containing protein [Anaerolineales bacterium]|nr:SPFH domain-containing protein [Anaerolineales bacterium]